MGLVLRIEHRKQEKEAVFCRACIRGYGKDNQFVSHVSQAMIDTIIFTLSINCMNRSVLYKYQSKNIVSNVKGLKYLAHLIFVGIRSRIYLGNI